MEDEAKRQRTEIMNMIEKNKQNLQERKNVARQLKDSKAKLTQQSEDVKTQVQTFIDNLIAVLEKKKQNIFDAVENQTKQSVENLTAETIKIENEIKEIETSLEKAEKLLIRSCDIEVVPQNDSQDIFEGTDQNKPVAHDPGSLPTVVFVKNGNLMETVKREAIGSLEISHHTKASQSIAEGKGLNQACAGVDSEFNLITRDCEKTMRYNKNDLVTVKIQDEQKRDCEMKVRIQHENNGKYHVSYCPRDPGRYSISIKVNEQHVSGSPYNLVVKTREQAVSFGYLSSGGKNSGGHTPSPSASRYFSPKQGACSQAMSRTTLQFDRLLSFRNKRSSVGKQSEPCGVAVSDMDEIAVTDLGMHDVKIFDSNGKQLRTFGGLGTNKKRLRKPRGICFHNNRHILVADHGNSTVKFFTREGSFKGHLSEKENFNSKLNHPRGLSLDNKGNIIVADSGNKVIKIFRTDGKLLRKIKGRPGGFKYPVHCIQCDERLIVADSWEHSIKVFSKEGKFKYQFGRQGRGDGEFHFPCFLSVTQSKHLMVCDSGNNRIQVFDLGGNFVGKFGTKGDKLGQFNCPTSVAVLSNDRIAVCESANKRIQICDLQLRGKFRSNLFFL